MSRLAVFLIILTVLFFGGIFLLGNFYLAHKTIDVSQESGVKLADITSKISVKFNFTSKLNTFNTVYIRLKNPQLKNSDPFKFFLLDSSGKILREIDLSGRNIGDDEDVRFQFPQVGGAKDRVFTVLLTSATQTPGQAVRVFTDQEGTPVFQVFSSGPFISGFVLTLSNCLFSFAHDPVFALFYGVLLLLTAALIVKWRV